MSDPFTSTLTKFGVPLGGSAGRNGLLQPKFAYRFRVRVFQFGPLNSGVDLTQQVQSVGKPSLRQNEIVIDSYNSKAWFAGKHEWQTVEMVLKDDITNAVSKLVGEQMQKQLNHLEQTAYAAGHAYKFSMVVETMDGGNDVVLDYWHLEGCWLTDTRFQALDYGSNEYQKITCTIRFDNATLAGINGDLMPRVPANNGGVHVS
jgi:hypothetical protein